MAVNPVKVTVEEFAPKISWFEGKSSLVPFALWTEYLSSANGSKNPLLTLTSAKLTVTDPTSSVDFPPTWRLTLRLEVERSTSDTFSALNGANNSFLSSFIIWGIATLKGPLNLLGAVGNPPLLTPDTFATSPRVAFNPLLSTDTTLLYVTRVLPSIL